MANGRETNPLAIVSMVAGIVSWAFLPLLAAIAAIVTGHMARAQIRESGGTQDGDAFAIVGLVLGYVNLAIGCLALVGIVVLVAMFGSLAAAMQAAGG